MTEFRPIPTNREVAERLGVSRSTVSRTLKRDPRWWTQWRRDLRLKALALYEQGMTWRQVGEALGGVSEEAARALGRRARLTREAQQPDAETADLFEPPNLSLVRPE